MSPAFKFIKNCILFKTFYMHYQKNKFKFVKFLIKYYFIKQKCYKKIKKILQKTVDKIILRDYNVGNKIQKGGLET